MLREPRLCYSRESECAYAIFIPLLIAASFLAHARPMSSSVEGLAPAHMVLEVRLRFYDLAPSLSRTLSTAPLSLAHPCLGSDCKIARHPLLHLIQQQPTSQMHTHSQNTHIPMYTMRHCGVCVCVYVCCPGVRATVQ